MPETSASITPSHISLSLPSKFPFSDSPPPLPPPHISIFLNEINLPLLVESLMKLNPLDGAQLWPSALMVTIKTNKPYHHHSNLYLFLFFLFPFLDLFFRPIHPFISLSLFYRFPQLVNFRNIHFHSDELLFSINNETLSNPLVNFRNIHFHSDELLFSINSETLSNPLSVFGLSTYIYI